MSVLIKRALMQIKTKKMKSMLLLCSFFVISNFMIVMYSVQRNVEDTKFLIRSQMSGIVEYNVDQEALKNYYLEEICQSNLTCWSEYSSSKDFVVTSNEIKELTEDKRVVAINGKVYDTVSSLSISPIIKEENISNFNEATYGQEFKLVGNGYPDMIEFHSKDYSLISGRFYNDKEISNFDQVALITEDIALENNLKVGDYITLGDKRYDSSGGDTEGIAGYVNVLEGVFLELEIIGIYSNNQTQEDHQDDTIEVFQNLENSILIPSSTLIEYTREKNNFEFKAIYENGGFFINEEEYLSSLYTMDRDDILNEAKIGQYFLLNDPNDIDEFIQDYKYLEENFRVLNANNEQYLRLKNPLDLLGKISQVIFIITVIVSIVFMSLVTTFNFKIREYEFGLQLSLGVTKIRIIFQLFIELLIISTIGFLLSLVSSRMIASQVDNMVIDYMLYESEKINIDDSLSFNFNETTNYFEEIRPESFFENYKSEWSISFILLVYILMIVVILVSCIIPITGLLKQSPKAILMNRE